jgi:AcrR family transcriptional regulator
LRSQLVAAAVAVVSAGGPSALQVRAVARRLNVSHAAPAAHFPSRDALLSAVAAEGFRRLETVLEISGRDCKSGVVRLAALADAYAQFAFAAPGLLATMMLAPMPPTPELAAAREAAFTVLVRAVQAAQANGWRRRRDTVSIAAALWSTVHGFAALWTSGSLAQVLDERTLATAFQRVADETLLAE